ncbi:hypothetical protein Tco_1221176 [Tanacetum coccineum]
MSIHLPNHTYQYPMEVAENMLVQVGKFDFTEVDINKKTKIQAKSDKNRTRDGKVCEDEAQSKSSQLREEKAKKNITCGVSKMQTLVILLRNKRKG